MTVPFLKLALQGATEPVLINAAHVASVRVHGVGAVLTMADGTRNYVDHTFDEIEQTLAAAPDVEIRILKEPTYLGTGVPQAVHDALIAVQGQCPEVVQVFFGIDRRWRYMDEDYNAPPFYDRVDVSILEAAAAAVPYLPFAASLPCPSSN